jgi:hypothetical protein
MSLCLNNRSFWTDGGKDTNGEAVVLIFQSTSTNMLATVLFTLVHQFNPTDSHAFSFNEVFFTMCIYIVYVCIRGFKAGGFPRFNLRCTHYYCSSVVGYQSVRGGGSSLAGFEMLILPRKDSCHFCMMLTFACAALKCAKEHFKQTSRCPYRAFGRHLRVQ